MDIRNRLADVIKLRCNACQDFLNLILSDVPDWQQEIYKKAKEEINTNGRYKDKYIPAYEKMREIGIENYSVYDMDITFISMFVHVFKKVVPISDYTKRCIEQLTEDRNLANHSNENEDDEELYLRGLLALVNLKSFVRSVDKNETTIPDSERVEYRKKYTDEIERLKDVLDDERITLVQRSKDMNRDFKSVLDCQTEEERRDLWGKIESIYTERLFKVEKNLDGYCDFFLKASDYGIREANEVAITACLSYKRDYDDGIRRLQNFYISFECIPEHEAKFIVDMINNYYARKNMLTEDLRVLIKKIAEQGYTIEEDNEGCFIWKGRAKA